MPVVLAVVAFGCGGGDEGRSDRSAAAEGIDDALARVAKGPQACARPREIVHGDLPATPASCRAMFFDPAPDLEGADTETFGSAAGAILEDGTMFVFALDRDGRFKLITRSRAPEPEFGPSETSDEVAYQSLLAIAHGSCQRFLRLYLPRYTPGGPKGAALCQASPFDELRRVLPLNPPRPRRLGAHGPWIFYGVRLVDGTSYTMTVTALPNSWVVNAIARGPDTN